MLSEQCSSWYSRYHPCFHLFWCCCMCTTMKITLLSWRPSRSGRPDRLIFLRCSQSATISDRSRQMLETERKWTQCNSGAMQSQETTLALRAWPPAGRFPCRHYEMPRIFPAWPRADPAWLGTKSKSTRGSNLELKRNVQSHDKIEVTRLNVKRGK